MAHTLQKVNVGNNVLAVVKITNYVLGGESFTLAELGLTGSVVDILFITDQSGGIQPVFQGGKVLLVNQLANPVPHEVPTTTGLNYVFAAIVQGTN